MIRRLIGAAAAAAWLVTLVSFFGRFFWLPELVTHFRMQMAVGGILLGAAALGVRMNRAALLLAAVAVIHLFPMAAYLWRDGEVAKAHPATFRVLSANVNKRNPHHAPLEKLILETRPDVVGLIEADDRWVNSLDRIASSFPYVISRPQDGSFGLFLMSRMPLRELDGSPYLHEGTQTAILAELDVGGRTTNIVLAHLRAPTLPGEAGGRNQQLAELAEFLRESRGTERILIGDLNVTPWSPHYGVLEADTDMTNAARGRGYLATWPVGLPIMYIPIDHCLLSDGLDVAAIRVGPDIGSDHLPLIVDVGVPDLRGGEVRPAP